MFFSNFDLDKSSFFLFFFNLVLTLNQIITKSFCLRPLTNVLTRKSNVRPGGPYFGLNSPLYGAKRQSNDWMGGFGIEWYIIRYRYSVYFTFETRYSINLFELTPAALLDFLGTLVLPIIP